MISRYKRLITHLMCINKINIPPPWKGGNCHGGGANCMVFDGVANFLRINIKYNIHNYIIIIKIFLRAAYFNFPWGSNVATLRDTNFY